MATKNIRIRTRTVLSTNISTVTNALPNEIVITADTHQLYMGGSDGKLYKVESPQILPIILNPVEWTAESNFFKYVISGLNFTANAVITIIPPSPTSGYLSAFEDAEFYSYADASTIGNIVLFAKNHPQSNVVITLIIQ